MRQLVGYLFSNARTLLARYVATWLVSTLVRLAGDSRYGTRLCSRELPVCQLVGYLVIHLVSSLINELGFRVEGFGFTV